MTSTSMRGLGGPHNIDPFTGDFLMPLTVIAPIEVGASLAVTESASPNYAQLSVANMNFDLSEVNVAGDRHARPGRSGYPSATTSGVTVAADSIVVPQGVYLAEAILNLHVNTTGSILKFVVTGQGSGTITLGGTHIYSWRSAQNQDDAGGWAPGVAYRTTARMLALFDTSEYIDSTAHAAKTRADVVLKTPKFGSSEPLNFRIQSNTATGACTLYPGSYIKLTRLGMAGSLTKAASDL